MYFLPAIYVLWDWWPIYFSWTAEAKLAVLDRMHSGEPPGFQQLLRANRLNIVLLAYASASYRHLRKYRQQELSNPHRLQWLLRFTQWFASILILFILMPFLFLNLSWLDPTLTELSFVVILSVSIHVLSYLVLGKDRVLPESRLAGKSEKYATSPLNEREIANKKRALLHYLETERPWQDPNFSISDLSGALQIPKHHLSRILSEGLQQNFYELVCQYRIEEIKRRLKAGDMEQYSILGIARDCGFGSKSSFNQAISRSGYRKMKE